jgi:hypothetical protein
MTIIYKKNKAVFSDVVGAEEAEGLLEWLIKNPKGKADLAGISHLHPANLQVLLAAHCTVTALPKDHGLAAWIAPALKTA